MARPLLRVTLGTFGLLLAAACGASDSGTSGGAAPCGAGTTLVNGQCTPACGAGTVFDDATGKCVSASAGAAGSGTTAGAGGTSGEAGTSAAGTGGTSTAGGAGEAGSGQAGGPAGAAGASAGASGAGPFPNGDAACLQTFIDAGQFVNCSDTCGANTCTPEAGATCQLAKPPAGPHTFIIRTPSHPGKATCSNCPNDTAGVYRFVVSGFSGVNQYSMRVDPPWYIRSGGGCGGMVEGCIIGTATTGAKFFVYTDDPNAPARNVYVSTDHPPNSWGKVDQACLDAAL